MTLTLFTPEELDDVLDPPEVPGELITMEFVGIPYPQGNKSAIWNERLGRAVMVEGNNNNARMRHDAWRGAVINGCRAYLTAHPRTPIDEPVEIELWFRFPPVSSDPHRTRHTVKPDQDKVLRATLDALVLGGLLKDDALVCDAHVHKRYARGDESAGASLVVGLLGAEESADRERSKYRAKEARRR